MAELIGVTLTDGKKTEIVNLDHITRIQPMDGSSVVIMTDGTTIAVRGNPLLRQPKPKRRLAGLKRWAWGRERRRD
jgi:hypothetical protein